MIDDYLAAVQLLGNWLAQFINFFSYWVLKHDHHEHGAITV